MGAFWVSLQGLLLSAISTFGEGLALVSAGTSADIGRIAGELLRGPYRMAVVGPFARDAEFRSAIGA